MQEWTRERVARFKLGDHVKLCPVGPPDLLGAAQEFEPRSQRFEAKECTRLRQSACAGKFPSFGDFVESSESACGLLTDALLQSVAIVPTRDGGCGLLQLNRPIPRNLVMLSTADDCPHEDVQHAGGSLAPVSSASVGGGASGADSADDGSVSPVSYASLGGSGGGDNDGDSDSSLSAVSSFSFGADSAAAAGAGVERTGAGVSGGGMTSGWSPAAALEAMPDNCGACVGFAQLRIVAGARTLHACTQLTLCDTTVVGFPVAPSPPAQRTVFASWCAAQTSCYNALAHLSAWG